MDPEWRLPASVKDVWDFTENKLKKREASHLDAILMQFGDDIIQTRTVPQPEDDQIVYRTWQSASPAERHQLAHLFIRSVGHATFPDDSIAEEEP